MSISFTFSVNFTKVSDTKKNWYQRKIEKENVHKITRKVQLHFLNKKSSKKWSPPSLMQFELFETYLHKCAQHLWCHVFKLDSEILLQLLQGVGFFA